MKNYSICILLFIIISSCSSDENETNTDTDKVSDQLLGTWNLQLYENRYNVLESTESLNEFGQNFDYTITISENPNLITSQGSYDVYDNNDFKYSIVSNDNQQEGFYKGDWSIEDDILKTMAYESNPDEEGAYDLTTQIDKLTDTTLILIIKKEQFNTSSKEYSDQAIFVFKR